MDTQTKPHVLIGLPTMGNIHTLLSMLIVAWCVQATKNQDVSISLYPTIGVQPVDNARNEIVEEFMKHKEYTHLLFIDADTIPPQSALLRMLSHDKDIVSALTPIVESNDGVEFFRKWNVVGFDDKHMQPGNGLVKAKAAGGSCIMIKKKVIEGLPKPHYRFLYEDAKGKPVIVSEDIYFTVHALDAGFEIWADTDLICKHNKTALW